MIKIKTNEKDLILFLFKISSFLSALVIANLSKLSRQNFHILIEIKEFIRKSRIDLRTDSSLDFNETRSDEANFIASIACFSLATRKLCDQGHLTESFVSKYIFCFQLERKNH